MGFKSFEHKLVKKIREDFKSFSSERADENIYVACSGGADSVALFISLNKIKVLLGAQIHLLHVHHGPSGDPEQVKYRDDALSFCRELAQSYGCSFVFEKAEAELSSEETCRNFRLEVFSHYESVFLAQHQDDFTETLLLRLIRGTGAQGLTNPFSRGLRRPFLNLFGRAEILSYLEGCKVSYLEDPSNKNEDYLRNWLRNKWLPDLKKKNGIKGLAKSLQVISEELSASKMQEHKEIIFQEGLGGGGNLSSGSFSYPYWLSLSRFQKQSTIAHVLLKVLKSGYTKGQVDEVLKNLDLLKRTNTFKVCGLCWTKDEDEVTFKKL